MTDWKKNFHFLSKTCPAAAIIIALFWYFGLPFILSLSLSLSLFIIPLPIICWPIVMTL